MKKRYTIPAALIIIAVIAFSSWWRSDDVTERSDRARDGLLGKVESVTYKGAKDADIVNMAALAAYNSGV